MRTGHSKKPREIGADGAVKAYPAAANILLVERCASYAGKVESILRHAAGFRFNVFHAARLEEACRVLADVPIDLVLLDLCLTDNRGIETLRAAKAAAPNVPVIALTDDDADSMATDALREGAQDYLTKDDALSANLVRSIRYAIERHRTLVEHKDLELRFLQSQKLEAVGRLAGGVAHDFNNLLTAILGYCGILERGMRDETMLNDLREIADASKRAAALTRQLLAFSRRQVLAPKILNLNAVVSAMQRMLGRIIGEDFALVATLEPGLANVKADSAQMEQVLMNLVVNARDAMPQGGPIWISTSNVSFGEDSPSRHDVIPAGRYAMIAVSDQGCGMDPGTLSHIFEPFFTTKEQGRGSGLGLSTVYGIVKQSGGYIWVYSEVGKGSTLKIYLPICDEAVLTAATNEAPGPTLRGDETILLAEDDASVRCMLERVLRQHGYTVVSARDGREAMSHIDRRGAEFRLLLTDIVMPHIGGRELAAHAARGCPQARVIFMSGYTDDVIIRHGQLDPGTVFVQKPVSTDSLLHKIRMTLERGSSVKETAS